MKPTVYFDDKSRTYWLSVRLSGQDVSATLKSIDRTWRALAPGTYLRKYFLSDQLESCTGVTKGRGSCLAVVLV